MRASNNESLEPARPQIGKAGANVEDQDTHGDSIWLIVGYYVLASYEHIARQLS
jgi:hypothetical protein